MNWIETYAKTHLFYVVLIVVGVFAFRVWLSEHDARVQAENVAKQQEVLVASLKQQIQATEAQAEVRVQSVNAMVKKATTPSEVVNTLPSLTPLPLHPQLVPNKPEVVEVDAEPLVQLAGEAKTAEVQLAACQQVKGLQEQELTAKDVEIKALKKKPRFFTRLKHVSEAVGVGIGIGVLLVVR